MNSSALSSVSRPTKVGANILCAWSLLNILPGVGSLVFIALGHHAPALRMLFAAEEIEPLDRRALAAIDGIAILANTLIVVYFGTAFFVVLWCLRRGHRWSFFVMTAGVSVLQAAGYISDHFLFLGKNIVLLNVSSLILLVSLGLCARGLFMTASDSRAR